MTQRSKLRAITHRSTAGRSSVVLLGRGAARLAGDEVLPEVWVDKAAVEMADRSALRFIKKGSGIVSCWPFQLQTWYWCARIVWPAYLMSP